MRCLKCSTLLAREKVEGSDNILMAILLLLPPKSVYKCTFVSKRWKSIIHDAYFLKTYNARTRRVLAVIQATPDLVQKPPAFRRDKSRPPLMSILPVIPVEDAELLKPVFPYSLGYFIHSCNGLILCDHHTHKSYYVLNPLTKSYVALPPPPKIHDSPTMALLCFENNTHKFELEYKIILASGELSGNIIPIHIYNSKTGKWTSWNLIGSQSFTLGWTKPPLALNGVLHWYSSSHTLAIYDFTYYPHRHGENRVQLIELPPQDEGGCTSSFTRSTSDDALWYCMANFDGMKCWMLPKGENGNYTSLSNEWILMHDISNYSLVEDASASYSRYRRQGWKGRKQWSIEYMTRVITGRWFRLEAVVPLNDTLVVVLRSAYTDATFLYDLKSNSFEYVHCYYSGICDVVGVLGEQNQEYGWYPYVESLSMSSFAL